ncbi:DUF4012 domain-containing protein [Arthrobacter sp. NPDC093139]|uniref:DUF4012 domain-containing protein n=1 Tax=Arthrobacter sp. NPDC093139 TaxID=3363945 RepID=UPI0037FB5589
MAASACAACLAGAIVLGAVWLGYKASQIEQQLQAVARLMPQVKASLLENDAGTATRSVQEMARHTMQARSVANDPMWTLAGTLPWIGDNFKAVSEIATTADDVANRGAAPLVGSLQSFNWESLAPTGQGIDLSPLKAAAPKLASAADALKQSGNRLNAIDSGRLLPQSAEPLADARQQLASFSESLDYAADAARIAPSIMGADSQRNYLLLIQNNAESRATGGIPGALAVLTLDGGKMTLGRQVSAAAFGITSPPVAVEREQAQIYSGRPGKFIQDVNLTPDFPTSASTAQAMWERRTGEHLDGVISVDPIALSYLLSVTGPVSLPDAQFPALDGKLPKQLTSKNVAKTLMSDVYAQILEPSGQDAYFAGVAKETFAALSSGGDDSKKLIKAISKGIDERRILLWSKVPREQSILSKYPLSGSVSGPSISPAQFGVYFNDGTGAKMDYHVKRTVQLIEKCPANGYYETKVRIISTNTAPKDAATSLPEYVTGGGAFGVPAGSVQTNIVAYGPVQSNVENVFVSGKKTDFSAHQHQGRPVGVVTVRLAPGQSSTVEFAFGKIVQHAEPKLSVTPTVQASKDVVMDNISESCPSTP